MLNPSFSGPFKKDLALMEKRRRNIPKLREVMDMLIQEILLPPRYKNHRLHGNYEGKWECHIEPDWLLIYRIDTANRQIVFSRTGSHSDLF